MRAARLKGQSCSLIEEGTVARSKSRRVRGLFSQVQHHFSHQRIVGKNVVRQVSWYRIISTRYRLYTIVGILNNSSQVLTYGCTL
jgi:hypothetical protein